MHKVLDYLRNIFSNTYDLEKLIKLAKRRDINPYSNDALVTIQTPSVSSSIAIMEHAISVDPYDGYMVRLDMPIPNLRYIYISDWYSADGRVIDSDVIYNWLALVEQLYAIYSPGIKYEQHTRIHKNCAMIKPMLDEAEVLLEALLNV